MPKLDFHTRQQFTSLQHSIRLSMQRLEAEIVMAVNASDKTLELRLVAERAPLRAALNDAIDAEIAYIGSQTAPSAAEQGVREAAQDARGVVTGLKAVADVLNAAAQLATIVARLAALL
jgi:hypothetical protein